MPRTQLTKAERTSFRPKNSPRYGLRRDQYRRQAEDVLRWKGEMQDMILVPFMYSPEEDRYCIKIADSKFSGQDAPIWRRIKFDEWDPKTAPGPRHGI